MANKTQKQEQAPQQQTEQITFNMDTINRLINSDNYKERLVGELFEVTFRAEKLSQMLDKYLHGKLDFTPACSYDILHEQFIYMKNYISILGQRCRIEKIDIREYAENASETEKDVSVKEQKNTEN